MKINTFQIVKFEKLTLPVVNITITKKKVSKLYKWFWKDCDIMKLYNVKITKTASKDVTVLYLSNNEILMVDQDISYIENAINSLKI